MPSLAVVNGVAPNIMWFHIERNSAVVPERRARKPDTTQVGFDGGVRWVPYMVAVGFRGPHLAHLVPAVLPRRTESLILRTCHIRQEGCVVCPRHRQSFPGRWS